MTDILAFSSNFLEVPIELNQADRLGQTVLHFAAKLGFPQLCSYLVELGASPVAPDLEGNTPVHYAIQYKQREAFGVLLNAIVSENSFDKVNSEDAEMTLASHCVVNQSWHCLASLIQKVTLEVAIDSTPKQGVFQDRTPQQYAEEAELI